MRYGSLFTGAGGFELGLGELGWECVWMSEIETKARQLLEHRFPGTPLYGDIKELSGYDLKPVEVIVGGFPCQNLSVAGDRKGFKGNKSSLFYHYVRIVEEMRDATDGTFPRWAGWENVGGLATMRTGELDSIYSAWANIGAVVQEHRLLDTGRAFGIPQRRRRILAVVGFDTRSEHIGPILFDTESSGRDSATVQARTSEEDPSDATNSVRGNLGRRIFVKTHKAKSTQDSEIWRERDVAPTLTVAGIGNACRAEMVVVQSSHVGTISPNWRAIGNTQVDEGLVIPVELDGELTARRITPTEGDKLMGWPRNWTEIADSDTARFRLIGNGLTAPAAKWLGEQIERADEKCQNLNI